MSARRRANQHHVPLLCLLERRRTRLPHRGAHFTFNIQADAKASNTASNSYRGGAGGAAQDIELRHTHRMEPRVLPVQRSPQGDKHMALTALFLEKAWKVTPRVTEHPGSAASTQPETFPSA